jgi:hypothetical protein
MSIIIIPASIIGWARERGDRYPRRWAGKWYPVTEGTDAADVQRRLEARTVGFTADLAVLPAGKLAHSAAVPTIMSVHERSDALLMEGIAMPTTTATPARYVTYAGASQMTGISIETIRRWVREKKIRAYPPAAD